jgi:hypothetical protein
MARQRKTTTPAAGRKTATRKTATAARKTTTARAAATANPGPAATPSRASSNSSARLTRLGIIAPPPPPTNGSVADITAFPLLTEDISIPSAPSGAGAGGGGDVGQVAFAAVRDVLGWRPKTDDARGFKAALEKSFQITEVEGHISWKYTPRGYAMMADMGAVTGVQASLLNRARSAIDLAKPLVISLTPLSCTACDVDYEPIRSMVLGELDAMVSELSQPAGPRIQVVDDVFRQLIGSAIVDPVLDPQLIVKPSGSAVAARRRETSFEAELRATVARSGLDPIEMGLIYGIRLRQLLRDGAVNARENVVQGLGHLYTLQERMGLNRNQVNTVEDEKIVSDFMTIEDTMFSLWLAWRTERGTFGRIVDTQGRPTVEPFLGTQLVLVSRSLGSIAEAVQETCFALDSVFLGAPERQTIRLDLADGTLFLSELLQWVEDMATTIGPRYLNDSGKDGVIAVTPTLIKVYNAVRATWTMVDPANRHADLPVAMSAPRVRFVLQKLASQLYQLLKLTTTFTRTAEAESLFEVAPTPMLPPSI